MSTLFERHTPREGLTRRPETDKELPELPRGVAVPTDIRELTHPSGLKNRRSASGIRWMRWLFAAALAVGAAITLGLVLRSDSTDTVVVEETPWTSPTGGPGSNTLAPTDLTFTTTWTNPTEGPGSNTLAP